ncbi:carboxyl-terminal-processing peptidase 2, chloroplastic-like isoform X1 [Cucurbita maxima]|uniref:C-terminal processing peptidase n=1 Tax=Cucurbita maxima TaxID=3661 RepID=A0A6J1L202_CUCMA|nr:carboxyl-terminal-processing peptidase 2, chloroplastic-like isoform X1 [Cucurbita maxima]XP_023006379.1 carboxyl-terminal-processing peptidase 2, chloroplastic-like isoform X1 [Cucurbita maxima]
MEFLSSCASSSSSQRFSFFNVQHQNTLSSRATVKSQVLPWNFSVVGLGRSTRLSADGRERTLGCNCGSNRVLLFRQFWRYHSCLASSFDLISLNYRYVFNWNVYQVNFRRIRSSLGKFRQRFSVKLARVMVCVMLVMSVSSTFGGTSSQALTEENLLFLEAWRTIDRAYIDKTFNGQSWFRYRENALRNEPMNTREETYTAIKKMLATLGDPFTRFLEPEKFKSLQSGTQGALTGVGLSIGYRTNVDGPAGLVVISAAPGGPAERAGITSGDVILAIDDTTTESMGIYDAAEQLQGPEGSSVQLTVQSGPSVKHLDLVREKVAINPVKSRICELPGSGDDSSKIGYIKLTSFTQKASGAVKEAIDYLRSNKVNAFVLDLRDNSGGLFPEGVEIAKIWLDKGVIVYICDSRGVRDIYDSDGSSSIAASEPLAVLVNKGTASASEILAGALKDNKRAILFGEPTYGKGKIQSVFKLSDGSGLAVTVARYETPAHIDIDKVGVIPDRPLPASFPKDGDGFCSCFEDAASACNVNRLQLFSR